MWRKTPKILQESLCLQTSGRKKKASPWHMHCVHSPNEETEHQLCSKTPDLPHPRCKCSRPHSVAEGGTPTYLTCFHDRQYALHCQCSVEQTKHRKLLTTLNRLQSNPCTLHPPYILLRMHTLHVYRLLIVTFLKQANEHAKRETAIQGKETDREKCRQNAGPISYPWLLAVNQVVSFGESWALCQGIFDQF